VLLLHLVVLFSLRECILSSKDNLVVALKSVHFLP
jgi:hypothetical protein